MHAAVAARCGDPAAGPRTAADSAARAARHPRSMDPDLMIFLALIGYAVLVTAIAAALVRRGGRRTG